MRKFLHCLLLGFIVGVGWPWVHGLFAHPPAMTLAGIGQTFRAIDGQEALFSLGACGFIGVIFGVFLKGEPSTGVQAFYALNSF